MNEYIVILASGSGFKEVHIRAVSVEIYRQNGEFVSVDFKGAIGTHAFAPKFVASVIQTSGVE